MKTHIIKVTEVKQNIGVFYIGKVNGCLLYRMAKADIRRIIDGQRYEGIQRELKRSRVSAIKRYLETAFAAFPNTIILNLNRDYLRKQTEEYIEIIENEDAFSIIDGQHRLSGFEDQNYENFELPVTIFIDLDISDQALLFGTINSEQEKVDPSLKLDLENYSRVETPKKLLSQMAYTFNIDKSSPWKGRIKLAGKKDENSPDGIISQKAFVEPILQYMYDERDSHSIRNRLMKQERFDNSEYDPKKYFLWKFYSEEKMVYLYKILLNYYSVICKLLPESWSKKMSILTKTTGYNAIMMLFRDVYWCCEKTRDFTENNMWEILKPIGRLDGQIIADNYGSSGGAASAKLYEHMKGILNI